MRTNTESAGHMRAIAAYRYGASPLTDDLYFVRCQDDRCKIGRTTNVESRMRSLRNSSPYPLELLLTIPGHGWQERVWHKAFAHLRRHLEWFELTDELALAMTAAREGRQWIATLRPPENVPDAQHWKAQVEFLADKSDRSVREFLWRNHIADLEESAADMVGARLSSPIPDTLNAGGCE